MTEIQSTPLCLCAHPLFEHEGELAPQCEANRCGCLSYRPIESRGHELNGKAHAITIEDILRAGKRSGFKRTVTLTEKIAVEINDLRGRLFDERQAAEIARVEAARKEGIRRDLVAAEAKVAELRARLNPPRKSAKKPEERVPKDKNISCTVKGCKEKFESNQRRAGHVRWHHPELAAAG